MSCSISHIMSATDVSMPAISKAPEKHTFVHSPQLSHNSLSRVIFPSTTCKALLGHTCIQAPQPIHLSGYTRSCGVRDSVSGLWHHLQLKLQPLKNTVVRIPGPSFKENRWIFVIIESYRLPSSVVSLYFLYNLTRCASHTYVGNGY